MSQNDDLSWRRSLTRPGGAVQTLIVSDVAYRFRWIPAGKFMMGSAKSDKDRQRDEFLHATTLTRGYWALESPVTQRMWTSVMGANPSYFCATGGGAAKVGGLSTDDFPVENVSWNDCQNFLERLEQLVRKETARSAFRFRLPTEAEWEYAARAGSDRLYSGSDDLDEVGWFDGNSGGRTHEVGTKQANAWGLRDMCGNVLEWTQDRYGHYASFCARTFGFNASAVDPQGDDRGTDRVARGGGWEDDPDYCRCAMRFYFDPAESSNDGGLRIALDYGE